MKKTIKSVSSAVAMLLLLTLTMLHATAQHNYKELAGNAFRYNRQAPLQLQQKLVSEEDGVEKYSISFSNSLGDVATGYLYVPLLAGKKAGIILQHGMPGNAEGQTPRANYYARQGAVVIALNSPWARNRPNAVFTLTPTDSSDQVAYIIELRRAIDVLQSRPEVDPERIGFVGISHSSAMGLLLAVADERLKACVLAVGDGGPVSALTSTGRKLGILEGMPKEASQRWLKAMQPVEPINYGALADGSKVFFQNGLKDQVVPAADAKAMHERVGNRAKVKWYDMGHRLTPEAYADQLSWFSEKLGMAKPTEETKQGPKFTASN